jgi:gas vesicle protein
MAHKECNHHGPGFSSGIMWGALIGAALGVLYAPDKGDETRKKIKDIADDVSEKGKFVAAEAQEIAEEVKVASQPLLTELEKNIKPVLEKAQKSGKEVQVEVMEKIEQLVEEASSGKSSKNMKKFMAGKKK